MHTLKLVISCAWIVFWIYWLVSAANSKESVSGGWRTRVSGVGAVGVFLIACWLSRGGASCCCRDIGPGQLGTREGTCGRAPGRPPGTDFR